MHRVPRQYANARGSRILDLTPADLRLPARVLPGRLISRVWVGLALAGLVWISLALVNGAVLAGCRHRLPAIRVRTFLRLGRGINDWQHANLGRIGCRIRDIRHIRKFVFVTRLAETVVLWRGLCYRSRWWVQPTHSRLYRIPVGDTQSLPVSG